MTGVENRAVESSAFSLAGVFHVGSRQHENARGIFGSLQIFLLIRSESLHDRKTEGVLKALAGLVLACVAGAWK